MYQGTIRFSHFSFKFVQEENVATALLSFLMARYPSQPMVAMLTGNRKAEVILTCSECIGHQTGASLIYGIPTSPMNIINPTSRPSPIFFMSGFWLPIITRKEPYISHCGGGFALSVRHAYARGKLDGSALGISIQESRPLRRPRRS